MTTSRSKQVNSLLLFSGLGVALPALFLYWQTSYPTVAYIDSGELAIVNWTLGIAHPTGYPLYTLIGRLFSLLPIELIKTQILLGMLCTTAAVVIVSFLGTLHVPAGTRGVPLRQWLCRIALGLLLAVSPLLWSQGVTNEVYSLHLVFLLLLLLILLQPYSDRNLILWRLSGRTVIRQSHVNYLDRPDRDRLFSRQPARRLPLVNADCDCGSCGNSRGFDLCLSSDPFCV